MKTPQKLTKEIMGLMREANEGFNNELCQVLDTLTDENCKPLPCISADLVEKLKDIAFSIYKHSEEIEYSEAEIVYQIDEFMK